MSLRSILTSPQAIILLSPYICQLLFSDCNAAIIDPLRAHHYTALNTATAIDITGIRRVVVSDLARPAYNRLPRDRQVEVRRRARTLAEGKEPPEQDFGGGILRFLLQDDIQVYIEILQNEVIVRHIV